MDESGSREADRERAGRIDSVGWGLFFIWVGVAFLAQLGWAVAILGVGVIALVAQAARKLSGLRVDPFGVVMGFAMVAWGGWHLVGLRFGFLRVAGGFMPMLLIALGVVLLLRAFVRRPRHGAGMQEEHT